MQTLLLWKSQAFIIFQNEAGKRPNISEYMFILQRNNEECHLSFVSLGGGCDKQLYSVWISEIGYNMIVVIGTTLVKVRLLWIGVVVMVNFIVAL